MIVKIEKFAQRAKFWAFEPRRRAMGSGLAVHSNDNQPGFLRPAGGQRPRRRETLACHWHLVDGRLQCRWEIETPDHPLNRARPTEPVVDAGGLRPTQAGRSVFWLRAAR